VNEVVSDPLPPEAELALAWSAPIVRGPLSIALQLDRRLARIVIRTHEPMLGQMRLAWWREALGKPAGERPQGDVVLDAIGNHWAGREAALIAMVDGWEVLMTADPLDGPAIAGFAQQRSAFFVALVDDHLEPLEREHVSAAAYRWAIADAAARVSDTDERAALIAAGVACRGTGGHLPKLLRGLAVLDALSRRALRRGGRPLMEGRGAPLAALKAAILLK
jgi:phytoene synthase